MSGVNHGYNSGSIKRVREAVKVEKSVIIMMTKA